MASSHIVTLSPDALTDESGGVLLGIVDGLAYVHIGPLADPVRVFFPNGDLTRPQVLAPNEPDPEAPGMIAIQETPRPSYLANADVLYDPTPAPFRWAEFADAFPALATSLGDDPDGTPLPPVLTPHQWAGE